MLCYLLEYAPDHLSFNTRVNHPALAFTGLGAGELLHCLLDRLRNHTPWGGSKARIISSSLAALATLAWPSALLLSSTDNAFTSTPPDRHLTATGPWEGNHLFDSFGALGTTILLPIFTLVVTIWVLRRRIGDASLRRAVFIASGPVLVATAFACLQLSWWPAADAQLVVLAAVAAVAGFSQLNLQRLFLLVSVCAIVVLPGLFTHGPRAPTDNLADSLASSEVVSSIERDLAHWLHRRTPAASPVVLSSPHLTPALAYYGSIHGLGTLGVENAAGDMAAIRMVRATSPAETIALLEAHGVSHIVLPSWDTLLDNYVRIGRKLPGDAPLPEDTFLHAISRWALPSWLQAVPYPLPQISGLENDTVVVFERTAESSERLALARLAEYFLEIGNGAGAANLRERLRAFATEPGTLPSLGQIDSALGDREALARTLTALHSAVASGEADYLPWDRRVSLAILLTQIRLLAPAKIQMQQCMDSMDAESLHRISAGTLLKFIALSRIHETPFPHSELESLAQ
ncbi:MAG: hypothetical protein J6386_18125 [Candidatus Synoicihabitans palmerolidicus]|nr:hypothetical protein [Candidatus Synoicihabitans palmerolidicus]